MTLLIAFKITRGSSDDNKVGMYWFGFLCFFGLLVFSNTLSLEGSIYYDLKALRPLDIVSESAAASMATRTSVGTTNATTTTSATTTTTAAAAAAAAAAATGSIEIFGGRNNTSTKEYAYVFLSYGCQPEKERASYRAYLANILASFKLLRKFGSKKADFVIILKMHPDSNSTRLLSQEEQMLLTLGVQIQYLPKTKYKWQESTNFYVNTLNKVHVLNMTQYERILFMDADVLPLTNLDYLFELSHGPDRIFKDNIIIPSRTLPMIAGFFVLRPNATAYQLLLDVIDEKFRKGKLGKQFDKINGWGHTFLGSDKEDYWIGNNDVKGTQWDYYCACTDQGIFYHYPKYMAQSMTQILSRRIINYGPSGGPEVVHIEKEWNFHKFEDSPLANYSIDQYPGMERPECSRVTKQFCSPGPYRDHAHFMGRDIKPWKHRPLHPILNRNGDNKDDDVPQPKPSTEMKPLQLWWETVASLKYEDNIDTEYLIEFQ